MRACFEHVYGTAEHVRRGVTDERKIADIGQILPLGAVDRVVRGHVHVRGTGSQHDLFGARNPCKLLGLHRRGDVDLADLLRLFGGFGRPDARHDVVRRGLGREQVHRHHRKLQARASLKKQHAVVRRHVRKFSDVGFGPREHVFEYLGPVADLENRHADARQRHQLALSLLEHRHRQHGGAGGEIENAFRFHESTTHREVLARTTSTSAA